MPRKPAFISHSPEREAEIQGRILDALEARFRRKVANGIAEASTGLISGYERVGFVPVVSDQDVAAMQAVYMDMALASARTFGARIVTQGKSYTDLETKEGFWANFFQSLAMSFVRQEPVRRRIQSVTDTTREQIVRQVAKGQEEGLGVDAIAGRIREAVPSISKRRGALIARTETHGAANYSAHETAKATGLELEKEWVSVEDYRTRRILLDDEYDHAAMNGQVRKMDEPFSMPTKSGMELPIMYPGEVGKPGAAVINCRCASVHRVIGLDD